MIVAIVVTSIGYADNCTISHAALRAVSFTDFICRMGKLLEGQRRSFGAIHRYPRVVVKHFKLIASIYQISGL